MVFVVTVFAALLSTGLMYRGVESLLRRTKDTGTSERESLLAELQQSREALEGFLQFQDSYISKQQFESLAAQVVAVTASLDRERQGLKDIEGSLNIVQKEIQEKEGSQQELRTRTEGDDQAVSRLLDEYPAVREDTMGTERQIAALMKGFEEAMGQERGLSAPQLAVLQDVLSTLTCAGAQLRALLTEYETLIRTLETIISQFIDLEDEYTRLVEQQLGK